MIKPVYLSKEIFELISLGSEISLHSVFNSSINFRLNNIIVNISVNNHILPPYGIVLKEKDFIVLNHEVASNKLNLNITNNEIIINNIKLDLINSAKKYDSKIINAKDKILDPKMQILKNKILYSEKKNGFDIENNLILDFILNDDTSTKSNLNEIDINTLDFFSNLNLLEKFFFNNDDDKALKYFIGRGRGLTPSGDDFLVGMMLVFAKHNAFGEKALNIRQFILSNKGMYTNDISEQFLILATKSKFSINILVLLDTLTNQEKIDDKAINNVLSYGGTSGVDIILGILFANQIINRSDINE